MKRRRVLFMSLFAALCVLGFAPAAFSIDYGDLDASRFPQSPGWENIRYQPGSSWVTKDVTKDFGRDNLVKNKRSVDNTPKLEKILNKLKGNAKWILKFPAGEYWFQTQCDITVGNFQLSGAGQGKTVFRFNEKDKGRRLQTGLVIGLEENRPLLNRTSLAATVKRNQRSAKLKNAGAYKVGDLVILQWDATGESWQNPMQIFKITSKSGNTVHFDMASGLDYPSNKSVVHRIKPLRNIKLEHITFRKEHPTYQLDKSERPGHNLVTLSGTENFLVENCEFTRIENKGPEAVYSKEGVVRQNYFHVGINRAVGSYHYGFQASWGSTRILIENNRADTLRHMFVLMVGASHCVLGYNRTNPPYESYADINFHHGAGANNNLVQGNLGEEITRNHGFYGSSYYNTYYRNHARSKLGAQSNKGTQFANVIANENEGNSYFCNGVKPYCGANISKIRKGQTWSGNVAVTWGKISKNYKYLPPSLYRTSKPDFLSKWPLYGPPTGRQPRPGMPNPPTDLRVEDTR